MIRCPHCIKHLEREKTPDGFYWRCPKCEGRAVTLPVLRKQLDPIYINHLWNASEEAPEGVACVFCQNKMHQPQVEPFPIDVCRPCQTMWFDTSEFESAPILNSPPPVGKNEISQRAREILAMAEIQRLRDKADAEETMNPPASGWQTILTVFGFPVEEEHSTAKLPWITWTLASMIAIVTVAVLIYQPKALEEWGLIPVQMWRHHGLTFVSSFFLHAGWLHLIGNLYFLIVFGDNVEDFLGKFRYLLLLMGAWLVGDFGHIFLDPNSTVPCVGASGGISGILGFYAIQFPRAKICICLRFYFMLRWIKIPAAALFLLWICLQGVTVYQQKLGISNVSGAAHMGGALFGVFIALIGKFARKRIV